ncbi:alcohol dehydrogenase/propanol-preferring alcohol dehydrogenase [Salinibacter ruber]|nr:alcohol dehydrogenase [Salinibacter ruber]MBB4088540.1 alcohol dehydrogenase/propanol-preferring alcohol dehydrogenase [Salinibacter ruber]MCS3612434.1 alcohol dehydrogenase/propanol-preferring alcohol dehydrogenase [Salinibacter ruber]MCS3646093.1 alcohol dehydrogenase/propanol-preferring alcohol dehydrogenase [Salinibacter ruber]MCS3672979.1 alcohol dehydrogenase/propanol-preferring alcohol dehydrogenase [Salinibacter ruber]MCS3783727.1 alcohol dehydrogenase/propanol-preferring alcohol de
MSTMQAARIPSAGADFEIVDLPVPDPDAHEVRVRVEACGICHSDAFVKEGTFPGLEYPRVPGHEVAGVVDAVGTDVTQWSEGDRVGVGWHGGHCFTCDACRTGDFVNCENGLVTGIHYDGGYAEYMTAPAEAVARMPEALAAEDAAPLLCAGITTFNALRNQDLQPGDLVAVQGIGGLGHLGVQYAAAMGLEVVALSTSADKEELAHDLGASHFVDVSSTDPAEALQHQGGADLILATAPNADAITSVVGGLGRDGDLVIVAATGEAVEVPPMALIQGRKSVSGWPSGDAKDSEDTLAFSAQAEALPEIETFSLEEAGAAYDRMINNEARFRAVLTMDH